VDFYDASFRRNPEHYHHLWRKLFNAVAVPAARRAAAIITISQHARRELVRYYGFDAGKIHPITLAAKSAARVEVTSEEVVALRAKWNIPADTYVVLHVGVLERRKNLPMLIRAFANARQRLSRPVKLVLAGSAPPQRDLDDSANIRLTATNYEVEDSVVLPGFISNEELAAAYQIATIYAFPSKVEGFGIPLLEAFHNDLPVISSNAMSLPEVAGEAAILLEPDAQEDWANALVTLLENAELRRDLARKGRLRAQQFSWHAAAKQILSICHEIVESRRHHHRSATLFYLKARNYD
jgi:glycosyltransferase involved in cell wall biosynthesis